jgi:anti-anti-sigma factor
MRADNDSPGLVVARSEAESGRFGLRLIGELDLSTMKVFDAQLGDTREQSQPSVIDVSELRFLDLTGLRALRRAGRGDGSLDSHLVGATGIVRRVIELARVLDAEKAGAFVPSLLRKPTRQVAAVASSPLSTAPEPIPAAP